MTKDARKIGKNLFPVHRKATISLSAASKVWVLLKVSAIADLQGMPSRLDWELDRVVHFDRPDPLTIDHYVVRATTDLRSDCLMRQLQHCRHLLTSLLSERLFFLVLAGETQRGGDRYSARPVTSNSLSNITAWLRGTT